MTLLARYEKLTPREQRGLQALGILTCALLTLTGCYTVSHSVLGAREHNADIRDQLAKIEKLAPLLLEKREAAKARDLLYARPTVPLASFIENAAKAQEIDVPESSDQPDSTSKGYLEHSTQAKFRKVGLRALVRALEHMARSNLPIAITALHVSARSQADEYDVSLTVSLYEKKTNDATKNGSAAEPKPKGQTL